MEVLQDGYIQVTKDCNQDCIFCTQPKTDNYMSFEEIKQFILDYKEKGITRIVYTGGEPTIHPNIVETIAFVKSQGMDQRMITNGAKLEDPKLCKMIVDAGLPKAIFSVHSHIEKVSTKLRTENHLAKSLKGIRNMLDLGCIVHINTTVTKENYPYLDKYAEFMTKEFPEIGHYCLNFVEVGGRAATNKWVIPRISEIELNLSRALKIFAKANKTFRVERVPLCYMCDFEEFSSETRRILGKQEYQTMFLNEEGTKLQRSGKTTSYLTDYHKGEACNKCSLEPICAGIKRSYFDLYKDKELYPMFKPIKFLIGKNISD